MSSLLEMFVLGMVFGSIITWFALNRIERANVECQSRVNVKADNLHK